MKMFNSDSGLKVGTKEAVGDSCKATIVYEEANRHDLPTIKFQIPDPEDKGKNNMLVMTSAFDMDSMMEMFGDNESTGGNSTTGASFDFFLPAFNTVKPDDTKGFRPRIFVFQQNLEYKITIGSSGWMTFVSDYNVLATDGSLEAYVVKKVNPGNTKSWAILERIPNYDSWGPRLKEGVPATC